MTVIHSQVEEGEGESSILSKKMGVDVGGGCGKCTDVIKGTLYN